MAVTLEANGGVSESIRIHSNQGTGVSSINVKSDVGGIKIESGKDDAASIRLSGYGLKFSGNDENDDISSIDSTENMDSKVEESTDGWIWDEESNEWIEDPNY